MHDPVLTPGDTIGVFSPSSALQNLQELDPSIHLLKERGYKVYIHPQTGARFGQSAGTHKEKADALHSLLRNPDIKVIWGARGGNRASQFLNLIDYEFWQKNPKPVLGYSDVTSLHCASFALSKVQSVQTPIFRELGTSLDKKQFTHLMDYLETGMIPPYPLQNTQIVKEGKATGTFMGGTLFVLASMIGTKYMPDFSGAILYLEDINEEISRIDRALQHLKDTIPFENLNGLIFGDFVDCKDTGTPYGFTLDDIIYEHTHNIEIPVIKNFPFGHGKSQYALPFGHKGKLRALKGDISVHL